MLLYLFKTASSLQAQQVCTACLVRWELGQAGFLLADVAFGSTAGWREGPLPFPTPRVCTGLSKSLAVGVCFHLCIRMIEGAYSLTV